MLTEMLLTQNILKLTALYTIQQSAVLTLLIHFTALALSFTFITLSFYKIFLFKTNIINSVIFALKFLILISLLIFIRGGVPRYRYDFLTKIG
jgi:NADH:ubiquinone oxidoreductase subunit H